LITSRSVFTRHNSHWWFVL